MAPERVRDLIPAALSYSLQNTQCIEKVLFYNILKPHKVNYGTLLGTKFVNLKELTNISFVLKAALILSFLRHTVDIKCIQGC